MPDIAYFFAQAAAIVDHCTDEKQQVFADAIAPSCLSIEKVAVVQVAQQQISLTELQRLHDRANRRRIGYDECMKRWKEFEVLSKAIVSRLPFQWEIIGCSNWANNHNGMSYGRDHLVLKQSIEIGRFSRAEGDALCKKRRAFNGNLWVDTVPDSYVSCKACLERAIKIIENQPDRPQSHTPPRSRTNDYPRRPIRPS
jgi:hypothetical protein